eukprot:5379417-Pyramimonas_sp.AAC.1
MAFGTSRHRAWAAGLRPRGWQTGSRGRRLGGARETVSEPLGSLQEASRELFSGLTELPGIVFGAS